MSALSTVLPLNVSIVQAPLEWAAKEANLSYFTEVMLPFSGKTDLIVLPEMFATGFVTEPAEVAEQMDGRVMKWMASAAAALQCVITGSVSIEENGRFFNRLVWMRPDGSYETADKRHLFSMGNEHLRFTAGTEPLIVELKGWKIKLLICYDLRFPVWSRNRYSNQAYAYDLLIYVANWPASRIHVWKTLLPARAIENLSYCIGVNRIGEDGHGLPHTGNSCVLDFKGRELLTAPPDEPFAKSVELNYSSLEEFRNRFAVGPDWDRFQIVD